MALIESSSTFVARRSVTATEGHAGDRSVVWLRGEHDIATMAMVTDAIARAVLLEDADVVVDLSGVQFMDASTVGAIVGAHTLLRRQSRALTLRSPSRIARRVLDVCGLADLIDRDPDSPPDASTSGALASWVAVPTLDRVDQRSGDQFNRDSHAVKVSSADAHHRTGELTTHSVWPDGS